MGRLFVLVAVINVALLVVALIDCLSTDRADVRGLPRLLWAFVIVLFSPIGPIAWLLAGRVRREPAGPAFWRPTGGTAAAPRRPLAPDDDPDFLRQLDNGRPRPRRKDLPRRDPSETNRTRRPNDPVAPGPEPISEDELLRRWEAELRAPDEGPTGEPNGDSRPADG